MKAAQISRFGGPEVFDIVDLPIPEFGPNQLLVRVMASGVNFAETKLRQNKFYPIELPIVLGSEVAGIVEAVGTDVTGFAIGDRVAVPLFAGVAKEGGYAEKAVINAEIAVRLPDDLGFDEAVAAMAQGMTALYMVKTVDPAGKRVLITSAAGGVGSLLVQLCKIAGADKVVGAVGSDTKRDTVLGLGADGAITYGKDGWAESTVEQLGGQPDIIFDGAGGDTIPACLEMLAPFGKYVLFSSRTMDHLSIGPAEAGRLNFMNQSIVGWSIVGFSTPEHVRNGLAELYGLIADGRIRPIVGSRYPLSEIAEAHRALESRDTIGKVLLTFDQG